MHSNIFWMTFHRGCTIPRADSETDEDYEEDAPSAGQDTTEGVASGSGSGSGSRVLNAVTTGREEAGELCPSAACAAKFPSTLRCCSCTITLRRLRSERQSELTRMRDGIIINFSSPMLDGGGKDYWIRQHLFPSLHRDIRNTTHTDAYRKHPERYLRWTHPPSAPMLWGSRIYKLGENHGGLYIHVWSYRNYYEYGKNNRARTQAWLEINLYKLLCLSKGQQIYVFHGESESKHANTALYPLLMGADSDADAAIEGTGAEAGKIRRSPENKSMCLPNFIIKKTRDGKPSRGGGGGGDSIRRRVSQYTQYNLETTYIL